MNAGNLSFDEPSPYHPHITLAQGFEPERLTELSEVARRRWSAWSGERRFEVDVVTFVQNTVGNRWLDLEELRLPQKLGPAPTRP